MSLAAFLTGKGRKLIVTRHNLNDPDPDKLKGYALCSLVNYKGDWFLNGFFTTSETGDEAFEEMKKVEEKKKNDRVPNYKHLKEISEDTGLFYFENKFHNFLPTKNSLSRNWA